MYLNPIWQNSDIDYLIILNNFISFVAKASIACFFLLCFFFKFHFIIYPLAQSVCQLVATFHYERSGESIYVQTHDRGWQRCPSGLYNQRWDHHQLFLLSRGWKWLTRTHPLTHRVKAWWQPNLTLRGSDTSTLWHSSRLTAACLSTRIISLGVVVFWLNYSRVAVNNLRGSLGPTGQPMLSS